jgi:hypothetical protein
MTAAKSNRRYAANTKRVSFVVILLNHVKEHVDAVINKLIYDAR